MKKPDGLLHMEQKNGEYSWPSGGRESIRLVWTASGDSIAPESVPYWHSFTGLPAEAVADWGWLAALHPEDREPARQFWIQAKKMRRLSIKSYRIASPEGLYQQVNFKCIPIFERDGTIKEWISWLTAVDPDTDQTTSAKMEPVKSQTLYSLIFEKASVGMLYLGLDGSILEANEQYRNLTGYTNDELRTLTYFDFTYPDDIDLGFVFQHVLLTGNAQPLAYEKRMRCKDGSTMWIKVSTTLLQSPSLEPLCFLSLIEDISERKKEEEEQSFFLTREQSTLASQKWVEQEQIALVNQHKTVFGAITEHIIVCDHEGNVLQANSTAQKLFAWKQARDFLGKSFFELTAGCTLCDENNKPLSKLQTPLYRILHGETLSPKNGVDIIVHTPSGQELHFNTSGDPIYNQRGQLIGGVCLLRNVTFQKRKESHIKQLLKTFLTLVEDLVQIPEHAVEAQPALPFQPSRILKAIGPRLAELIGRVIECEQVRVMTMEGPDDALHRVGTYDRSSEDASRYQPGCEQHVLSEYLDVPSIASIKANDIIVRDLNEQPFLHTTSFGLQNILVAPLSFDKHVVGLILIDKDRHDLDYTEEEIALVRAIAKLLTLVVEHVHVLNEWAITRANELALQETNRRFDAFISIASHELKTPLTTIKGNVQLAQRRLDMLLHQLFPTLSDEQNHAWERIKQPLNYAVQRVSVQDRMISDLLDVSRIKANQFELIVHPCNLVEIVQHTIEDQFILAPDRTINVEMPDEKCISIMADTDRISQVIANYVGNALKYSSSAQPVTIILTHEGHQARVAVQDKGPGLSPEDHQRVWERFYRVPGIEVRYGSGGGMGLGLHLCQTIITQHCGHVGLESTPGNGSTFWFTLPISDPIVAP